MDKNSVHSVSEEKGQECCGSGESHDSAVEDSSGQVERTEGGCAKADVTSKRSKGATGEARKGGSNKTLANLEDCMKGLMISQMRERPMLVVQEGIMTLLRRRCLAASPNGAVFVVMAGNAEHYECREGVDVGWGCGWRNLQTLVSYLLSEDPEMSETLFGGAGFVPDISALQQWLEISWAKGFDVPGGEFFDWKIKGSNNWIGTTEGAALLRSFGVRVRIVDFQATGGKRGPPSEVRIKTDRTEGHLHDDSSSSRGGFNGESAEPSGTATENAMLSQACIVCGEDKLDQDPEFGQEVKHSDMCTRCMKRLQGSGNTEKEKLPVEEETQITGRHRHGWDDKSGGGGTVQPGRVTMKHQQLVEWLWRYFMAETEKGEGPLILSRRSPLYFQRRGHSLTVVGIERRKVSTSPDSEEVNLLVLDPSEKTMNVVDSLQSDRGWEHLVKRGLLTLNQTEYQLCYCERGVAKGEELERLKVLTSKSYTY